MASGQLQFLSPDQKYCRNVNALSASRLQVDLPPRSRASPPFQMIETPLMLGYSTVVLLHQILWIQKSPPPAKKSLRSPGGMTDLLWWREGGLILTSTHMDAFHCLPWDAFSTPRHSQCPTTEALYGIRYMILPSDHAWQFCWAPCFTLVVPPEVAQGPSPSPQTEAEECRWFCPSWILN